MAIKEITINDDRQFKVQFEQAATKGVLGFKVEANDDDLDTCKAKATDLLQFALKRASLYLYANNTDKEIKNDNDLQTSRT